MGARIRRTEIKFGHNYVSSHRSDRGGGGRASRVAQAPRRSTGEPAGRGGAHEEGRGDGAWPAGGRAALAVGGGWSCPWRRPRLGPEARRALSRQSRVAPWSPRAPACWGRADRARGPDRPRRALFLFRFPGLGGGRAGGLRSGGGRWVGTRGGGPAARQVCAGDRGVPDTCRAGRWSPRGSGAGRACGARALRSGAARPARSNLSCPAISARVAPAPRRSTC